MKRWLLRCYPRVWRQRYGDEFLAMLEQHHVSVTDILDILRGAFDAHWNKGRVMEAENSYITLSIRIKRQTIRLITMIVCLYLFSYGVCRTSGLLVHAAQNRYTSSGQHRITSTHPFQSLALFYAPVEFGESLVWPAIDAIVAS